jgi:hypothetical protein
MARPAKPKPPKKAAASHGRHTPQRSAGISAIGPIAEPPPPPAVPEALATATQRAQAKKSSNGADAPPRPPAIPPASPRSAEAYAARHEEDLELDGIMDEDAAADILRKIRVLVNRDLDAKGDRLIEAYCRAVALHSEKGGENRDKKKLRWLFGFSGSIQADAKPGEFIVVLEIGFNLRETHTESETAGSASLAKQVAQNKEFFDRKTKDVMPEEPAGDDVEVDLSGAGDDDDAND